MNSVKMLLPDVISLLRIGFILPIWHFAGKKPVLSLVLLCVALATDALDGYLARRLNAKSVWGAILDPVADKLLYLGLMPIVLFSKIPLIFWVFVLSFPPEIILVAIRVLAKFGVINAEIPSNAVGKRKMWIQSFALLAMMAGIAFQSEPMMTAGLAASFAAIPFSYWSLGRHLNTRPQRAS